MAESNTTIPLGSRVLITGATGFLGAQVVKQFLQRGYKVRGTVRDLTTASWLVDDVFQSYAAGGDLELVQVPDLAASHAFDDAIKGVSAIVHIATVIPQSPDPSLSIPGTVAGATAILEAALEEPSVKSFVYTGSTAATTLFVPGNNTRVGRDTWNDALVQVAWAPPPYEPSRRMAVYAASKVAAEQAVWKFAEEKKPHFAMNVICPAMIWGEPLNSKHVTSFSNWVAYIYNGDPSIPGGGPATYAIDVKDVALLHAAAVLDPEVKNVRMQAWGHNTHFNEVLAIMRNHQPQRKFMDDFADLSMLSVSADFDLAISLLKKWGKQDGWTSLKETVLDNVKPLEALEA